MNDPKSLIEAKILSEGAFLLLSSSSIGRYFRMAESLSQETFLVEQLECGVVTVDALIQRVKELRFQLAAKKHRDVEEVELAIILTILSETASTVAANLLLEFGMQDPPPLTWISALARRLFQQQPENLVFPVNENISERPSGHGTFAYVRLEPSDWTDAEDFPTTPTSFVSLNDSHDVVNLELAA